MASTIERSDWSYEPAKETPTAFPPDRVVEKARSMSAGE